MVLLQNRKKGLRRMVNECLIVVTGFKAPWDAYKVSIGAEQEIDTVGDPMLELTTNKYFAAIVQFRHPYEVGGLYFLVNMCLPLLWLTILLALDLANENLSEGTLKLLTNLGIGLGITLVTLLGAFYLLINKEYRHTFYSSLTGPQMTRRNFLE
ncbi:hypothetical protein TrVE_jg1402, partial [Triparma verrucosa]